MLIHVLHLLMVRVFGWLVLLARKVLVRHQMLHAMHLAFGRLAFRP